MKCTSTVPASATYNSAHSGDSPVKNWGGIGVIDLPDRAGLHRDVIRSRVERGYAVAGTALLLVKQF